MDAIVGRPRGRLREPGRRAIGRLISAEAQAPDSPVFVHFERILHLSETDGQRAESERMATYSADDLALTALLKIVPGGYRLIDLSDQRFVGVRDRFQRLALKHLGPRPSLVGFVGPDQDALAAASAAAEWAGHNLVPSAIQRRVQPGVVVIASNPPPGTEAGLVAGAPVKTAIWTVDGGRLRSPGRPPGSPSPGLVRGAVASLERGEGPPSIGKIDVAERALMSGKPRRRSFTLGGGAGIGILLVGYLLLRTVPGLLFGRSQQNGTNACTAQNCVVLGSADSGKTVAVDQGMLVVVQLPAGGTGAGCTLLDSAAAVLQFEGCALDSARETDSYRAATPGTATLRRDGFIATVTVR